MMETEANTSGLSQDAESEKERYYRSVAIQICDELHAENLEALKFLSRDFVPNTKLERIRTPHELLSAWETCGKFGKENPFYLAECLYKIKRIDLLEDYLSFKEESMEDNLIFISYYRNLLYTIAEDLDDEEFHKICYLMKLKKKEQSRISSSLELILYLEQVKLLTQKNMRHLKELLSSIDRTDMVEMIQKYEEYNSNNSREENMDITESKPEVSSEVIKPQPEKERKAPPSPQFPTSQPVTPGCPSAVTPAVPPAVPSAVPPAALPTNQVKTPKAAVLNDSFMAEVVQKMSVCKQGTCLVFGYHLGITEETVKRLSVQYANQGQMVDQLLNVKFHDFKQDKTVAVSIVIHALHQAQVHDLAESLSRTYLEKEKLSLEQRALIPNHQNIPVNTGEAQYRGPDEAPAKRDNSNDEILEGRLQYYKMTAKPRGLCIIINNEVFTKDPLAQGARDLPHREGTQVDAGLLTETFTNLDFHVVVKNNLSSTEMVRFLTHIGFNFSHKEYDAFVCCLLSHGTQGFLYGCDGCLVNISDLTAPFKSISCPSLAGKPKLFFLQACQGKVKQRGLDIDKDCVLEDDLEKDGIPSEVIPNEADFLMGYATVPGFVSFRSRSRGSWYITSLCHHLNKHGKKVDILRILTMVNHEVGGSNADMEGETYKQSPAPHYTLGKILQFT